METLQGVFHGSETPHSVGTEVAGTRDLEWLVCSLRRKDESFQLSLIFYFWFSNHSCTSGALGMDAAAPCPETVMADAIEARIIFD